MSKLTGLGPEETIKILKGMLMMAEQKLAHFESMPEKSATVLGVDPDNGRADIACDGGILRTQLPVSKPMLDTLAKKADSEDWLPEQFKAACREAAKKVAAQLNAGDSVTVNPQGQITAVDDTPKIYALGKAHTVRGVDGSYIELEPENMSGATTFVYRLPNVQPEVGERVLLDHTGRVAMLALPKAKPSVPYKVDTLANLTWDDVGGLQQVKLFFKEALELPLKHPELFAKYGYTTPKGVLLYGPPGCGKTLVAKVVANEIARNRGANAAGFFSVKGPEILAPYVGVAEQRIRELFSAANIYAAESGNTAIVFIDECEAVMAKRGSGRSSDVDKSIVPSFLTEMDGMSTSNVFVILATNRPDMLDEAIVRPGRIDRKCIVPRPNAEAIHAICKIHFKGMPTAKDLDLESIATEAILSDDYPLFEILLKREDTARIFQLRHIVSGAMLANICQAAAAMAMRRDLSNGGKGKTFSGITQPDVIHAVREMAGQNVGLGHDSDVLEFIAPHKMDDVAQVTRMRY